MCECEYWEVTMQVAVHIWRNNAQLTACNRAKITYGLQSVPQKTETKQSTSQPDARAEQKTHKHNKQKTTFSMVECEYCEVSTFNLHLHDATTLNRDPVTVQESLTVYNPFPQRQKPSKQRRHQRHSQVRERNRKRKNMTNNRQHFPRVNVSTVK